jgi:hypothetical protein
VNRACYAESDGSRRCRETEFLLYGDLDAIARARERAEVLEEADSASEAGSIASGRRAMQNLMVHVAVGKPSSFSRILSTSTAIIPLISMPLAMLPASDAESASSSTSALSQIICSVGFRQ